MRIRTDDVVWQELDGELIILDLARSVYLTTNTSGSVLAKFLTEEHTLDEMAEHLQARFEISNEQARADSEAFVAQLQAKRLLA